MQRHINKEDVVRVEDRWGCCVYCDLEEDKKVQLHVSPLWPHQIRCPRCHRTWRTAEIYNRETKALMEAFLQYHTTSDMRSEEERQIDDAIDEGTEMRIKKSKKDPLFPYHSEEDKPSRIIVPNWKEGNVN